MNKWFLKDYGDKALSTITSDDLRDVVEKLDDAIDEGKIVAKRRKTSGTPSAGCSTTRRSPKKKALRLLETDPALGVEPPNDGIKKAKTLLYPSEYLQVVNHKHTSTQWRRVLSVRDLHVPAPG